MINAKSTMRPYELKAARKLLGLPQPEMANLLKTPLRTYQGWEQGETRIPGVAEVAVELLQQRDKWATDRTVSIVAAKIDLDHPNGIART